MKTMAKKRPKHHRYTKPERQVAVQRCANETKTAVAEDLQIARATLDKWIKEFGGVPYDFNEEETPTTRVGTIKDFVSRVRSILWGVDQRQYEQWLSRVEYFQSQDYSLPEAQVRAAKEFGALNLIFREYDVKQFDRDPDSHPNIVFFGDEKRKRQIVSLDQEMSYRDCLRWAASAAGAHLRTGEEFYEVPNDTAFYLYQQALADPKDFMTKFGTMENREDAEDMLEKSTRRQTERSVEEIDKWLGEIQGKVDAKASEKTSRLFYETAPNNEVQKDEDAAGH
jgi:hypothetical protein